MDKIRMYKIPAAVGYGLTPMAIEEKKLDSKYADLFDFSGIGDIVDINRIISIFNKFVIPANIDIFDYFVKYNSEINDPLNKLKFQLIFTNLITDLSKADGLINGIKNEEDSWNDNSSGLKAKYGNRQSYHGKLADNDCNSTITNIKQIDTSEIEYDSDGIPINYKEIHLSYTIEEQDIIWEKLESKISDNDKLNEEFGKIVNKIVNQDYDGFKTEIISNKILIRIDSTVFEGIRTKTSKLDETYAGVFGHEIAHIYITLLYPVQSFFSMKLQAKLYSNIKKMNEKIDITKEEKVKLETWKSEQKKGSGHFKYHFHDKRTNEIEDKTIAYYKKHKYDE